MRILITVTPDARGGWNIDLYSSKSSNHWSRRIGVASDAAGDVFPTRDPETKDPALSGLSNATADELEAVYQRIAGRKPKPGDLLDYGRYLFDVLIGSTIWRSITDEARECDADIELALHLDWRDGPLARLHWEMMASDRFLASGVVNADATRDVAITRIVPETPAEGKAARPVPRVLFIIGTSLLDPTIRPGAEMVGVIQQPGSESSIQWRHVENATPQSVTRMVALFQPDVVHFICHGGVDSKTHEGFLELRSDQERGDHRFVASQIEQWLRPRPGMVVLSACDSGATIGPDQMTPLAAELVKRGIPVVIGMSGRVSDIACRLFTRRFAEALMGSRRRETLVNATALGRRAAFSEGNDPEQSVDWAFPTVFLAGGVQTDFIPTTEHPEGFLTVEKRLVPYVLRRNPVFCGRQRFFDEFRDLMARDSGALAVHVQDEKKGYGRTRLLEELTIQALIDGHVPCAVLAKQWKWQTPKTVMDVALRIDEAMETARDSMRLPRRLERPILALEEFQRGTRKLESLPSELRRAIQLGMRPGSETEVNAEAVTVALELQFFQLMEKARKEKLADPKSRAVVLLDEVHEYMNLLEKVVGDKLGSYGFGTSTEPVPIVLAFSAPAAQSALLKPIAEGKRPGVNAVELAAFRRDPNYREDMLMYARYFVHTPLKLGDGGDEIPWLMDFEVDKGIIKNFERAYLLALSGIPSEFEEQTFFGLALVAQGQQFLKPANDSAYLDAQKDRQ